MFPCSVVSIVINPWSVVLVFVDMTTFLSSICLCSKDFWDLSLEYSICLCFKDFLYASFRRTFFLSYLNRKDFCFVP